MPVSTNSNQNQKKTLDTDQSSSSTPYSGIALLARMMISFMWILDPGCWSLDTGWWETSGQLTVTGYQENHGKTQEKRRPATAACRAWSKSNRIKETASNLQAQAAKW
jgi:hypothetical protein